jgi:hypothetical protein
MKYPGDKTPDPPGGRAAERLRLFEGARQSPSETKDRRPIVEAAEGPTVKPRKRARPQKKTKPTEKKRRSSAHAKQARRRD